MKDIKKSLLLVTTGLVITTAVTVIASRQSSILQNSIADLSNPNDRQLVLNGSTPLSITDGVGTLTVGNIGIKATNCVALENGIATIEGSDNVYIYCATAGLDGSGYNYGFGGSTIESITFIVNNHNGSAGTLSLGWVHLDETLEKASDTSIAQTTSLSLQQTSENQTKSPLSTDNFIKGQNNTANNSICFWHSKPSGHLDLISITITYSCN